MNIAVIGAGAVGGYFGGKLAAAGVPVTFIVRENRYQQLTKNGLTIRSTYGDFTIQPQLATTAKEAGQPDVVLLAVKNYHLDGAMPILQPLAANGTKILPLLNGISHIDVLTESLGEEAVLGGLCYIESTLSEAGEIVHTSQLQDIVFGALSTSTDQPFLTALEATLRNAGINTTLSPNIKTDMWKKFNFLAALSGITAAIRNPIGTALNDPITNAFLEDMLQEIITIAKAEHPTLPAETAEVTLKKLHSIEPTMTSSMHRDLEKGQPIELESLHGALLHIAEKHGIDAPTLRAVFALLHPYKGGDK